MIKDLDPVQKELENLMSTISERCHFAGWLQNLEFVLWNAVIHGERKYGHSKISQADIEKLIELSNMCNSWIYFDDKTEETAIDLASWKLMYKNATEENPGLV